MGRSRLFWWEAPTKILVRRKQDPKKNLEIIDFVLNISLSSTYSYYITREWEVEKGRGKDCVSHGTRDFLLTLFAYQLFDSPKRWHVIMNIHIHHCSSSALFRLPQRCYLHTFFLPRQKAAWSYQHIFWSYFLTVKKSQTFSWRVPCLTSASKPFQISSPESWRPKHSPFSPQVLIRLITALPSLLLFLLINSLNGHTL